MLRAAAKKQWIWTKGITSFFKKHQNTFSMRSNSPRSYEDKPHTNTFFFLFFCDFETHLRNYGFLLERRTGVIKFCALLYRLVMTSHLPLAAQVLSIASAETLNWTRLVSYISLTYTIPPKHLLHSLTDFIFLSTWKISFLKVRLTFLNISLSGYWCFRV